MKSKIYFFILLIFALCLVLPEAGISQEKKKRSKYTNAISFEALNLLFSKSMHVTYENQLQGDNIPLGIQSFTVFGSYYNISTNSFGIGGSCRWYPKLIPDRKKPFEGFGVGPFINLIFDEQHMVFSFGPEIAYKFIIDNWVVEPALKFNFFLNNTDYKPVNIGCNLGYAW